MNRRAVVDKWTRKRHYIWAELGTGECRYENDPTNPVDVDLLNQTAAQEREVYDLLRREPQLAGYAPGATRVHAVAVVGHRRFTWVCGLGASHAEQVTADPPPHDPRAPRTWLCRGCITQLVKRELARDREAARWRRFEQERRV